MGPIDSLFDLRALEPRILNGSAGFKNHGTTLFRAIYLNLSHRNRATDILRNRSQTYIEICNINDQNLSMMKVPVIPVHAMKAYGGSRGVAPIS